MKTVVMCGADVHENSMTTRIAVNKGEPETRVFRYSVRGRQSMFKHLKSMAQGHGAGRIVVAYEASSLGFGLCDECREAGIECYVLAPTKMPLSQEQRKSRDIVTGQEELKDIGPKHLRVRKFITFPQENRKRT